jgi:hypothetical protein
LEALDQNPGLRGQLLIKPESVLEKAGVDAADLDTEPAEEAMERSRRLIASAGLSPKEGTLTSWRKLGTAAEKEFSGKYRVDLHPFGMTLLEQGPIGMDWTATGGATCTYSPWDGCSPDPDS